MEILIFGAGSIGAHHAYASRYLKHDVTVYDNNDDALVRFKKELYPNRYKKFDDQIKLINSLDNLPDKKYFWIIGTPPDTHALILEYSLKYNPIGLLIEKPLSGPKDSKFKRVINKSLIRNIPHYVGYNLLLGKAVEASIKYIDDFQLQNPVYISVDINESWNGILNAHPWLDGAKDSYLGYTKRGGGALFEHSHGLSLGIFFLNHLEKSRKKVILKNSESLFEKTYDSFTQLTICKNKLICNVTQDVICEPARKELRIQFKNGMLLLKFNYEYNNDLLEIYKNNQLKLSKVFKKNRADDFIIELSKIFLSLNNREKKEVLGNDIIHGLEVNKILDDVNMY